MGFDEIQTLGRVAKATEAIEALLRANSVLRVMAITVLSAAFLAILIFGVIEIVVLRSILSR